MTLSWKSLSTYIAVAVLIGACASHKTNTAKSDAKATAAAPPAPTKAQAKSTAKAGTVKCTSGKDERVLEVKAKDAGCETLYTKMGEAKSVAKSENGMDYCQQVSAKIQKRLTSAGYACQ